MKIGVIKGRFFNNIHPIAECRRGAFLQSERPGRDNPRELERVRGLANLEAGLWSALQDMDPGAESGGCNCVGVRRHTK
jgi:hypothetical protein